jgi:hypothetical protein
MKGCFFLALKALKMATPHFLPDKHVPKQCAAISQKQFFPNRVALFALRQGADRRLVATHLHKKRGLILLLAHHMWD